MSVLNFRIIPSALYYAFSREKNSRYYVIVSRAILKLSVRMYKGSDTCYYHYQLRLILLQKFQCGIALHTPSTPLAVRVERILRNLINRRHSSRASSQQQRIVAIQLQYQFFIRRLF